MTRTKRLLSLLLTAAMLVAMLPVFGVTAAAAEEEYEITVNPPSKYTQTQSNVSYGRRESITYYSTTAGRNKNANVQLPANYDESKSYPVMYLLHGVMGSENDMVGNGTIIQNLVAEGLAEEMIIVCPNMWSSNTSASPGGINQATMEGYDRFHLDLVNDLMPYMAEHYAVAEGKENTAVCGFSQGGRETLLTGLYHPDKIGYLCAISSAPGIVAATDQYMSHPGVFKEDEVRYEGETPYLIMMVSGDRDSVVGTNPQNYHRIFEQNGIEHVWWEVPGADHGGATDSGVYNFARYAFKVQGGETCEHEYVDSVVAPTCTERGYTEHTCSKCGRTYKNEYTDALGHDYDDGVVTVAPTETAAGVRTFTCRRCGATQTKRIPKLGSTVPDDIDFTNPADADKFAIVGKESAAIVEGQGVTLITSQGGVEPAKQSIAETPLDVIEVEIDGDWIATLKFDFDTNGAANGYYQFFGFYGATDYNNMVGIRGGDGAMQDFIRKDGAISEELNTSTPGLSTNGTYWYRIEKEDTTYTCYRSSNGEDFTEMFSFADTGIDATKIVIDAYTGMTAGYKFVLKSLSFEDNGGPVVVPCEHDYKAVVTAPTCTAKGYTTYTCAKCGDSYVGDEVDALGHDYGEWAVTKAATCTEMGEETHTCSRCGTKETRLIAALDHDYRAVVTAPTCTEAGFTTYTCSRCGDSYKGDETAKLGHDYRAVVTAPTCTGAGYTTYTCARCNDSYVGGEVPALEHDYKDGVCTRCGAKDPNYQPPFRFDDVQDASQYYYEPVYWAVDKGVTKGTSEKLFSPGSGCTRAQVVTFLWRAAGEPEPDTYDNPFQDVKTGQYYYKAVLWAVGKGITKGTSDTTFRPDQTCTRAQIVTFLWRAKGQPEPASLDNPFSDVKTGEYYYKAVLWAVAAKITNGTTPNKFSPDATCTRGQIVTFLYRAK